MKLDKYIELQLAERYRCFVLCGAGLTGKTKKILGVVNTYGGKYIDVLKYFKNHESEISVQSIRPEQFFREFKLEENRLMVFDNLDFLFCLWTENQQKEFIRKLDMKSNGSCVVAVLHNYKLLEEEGLMRKGTRGQKRIVNIADFT